MDFESIISKVRAHHPKVEGIYLFGSFGTAMEQPDSDTPMEISF
jgi:hypothetical protein